VFVVSPQNTQHLGVRVETGWLEIRIMCLSGATCLPADCCSSKLAYKNPAKHVGVVYKANIIIIIVSSKCNLFSPWYGWKIADLALSNNYPLTPTDIVCWIFYHGHAQGFHLKPVAAEIWRLHFTLPPANFYVSRI
jgi:hypothetical protein